MKMNYSVDEIKALFPNEPYYDGDDNFNPRGAGRTSTAELMGEVIFHEQIGSYQGDGFVLVKNPELGIGFLSYGYGSCSFCDAWQGCEDYERLTELVNGILAGIKWNTPEALLSYFVSKDWDTEWYAHEDEFDGVRDKMIALLKTMCDPKALPDMPHEVLIYENELGSKKLEQTKTFPNFQEALDFVEKYNKAVKPDVDWFMSAEIKT